MAEINENMEDLNRSIQELSLILVNFGNNVSSASTSAKNAATNLKDASSVFSRSVGNVSKGLTDTIANSIKGIKDLSIAARDAGNEFTFASQSINIVAGAAASTAKQFGTLGKGTGFVIEAFSSLAQHVLSFGTSALEAKDIISSLGAYGKISSDEIRKLAENSQMYNGDVIKYARTIRSLNTDITALGGSVVQGINTFGKLAHITDEQRIQYQRLGITTDDLIAMTRDYVSLQSQSASFVSQEMIASNRLRKYTQEYTDNLITLAELTGGDIETKSRQAREANQIQELQTKYAQMSMEAQEKRAQGDEKSAIALENQIATMQKVMAEVSSMGSSAHTAAMANYLATRTINENNVLLTNQRFPLEELTKSIEQGSYKTGFALDNMRNGVMENVKTLGFAASHNKDVYRDFIGTTQGVAFSTKFLGKNFQDVTTTIERERLEREKGLSGKDPLEETRIEFQNVMKELQKFVSNFMQTLQNVLLPSIQNFAQWLRVGAEQLNQYLPKFETFMRETLTKLKSVIQEFEYSSKEILPIIIEAIGSIIPFAGPLVEKAREARLAARPRPSVSEEPSTEYKPSYLGTSTAGAGRGTVVPPMASQSNIGSDFLESYLRKTAMVESSGRADARNPRSSATGLYQFTESTWLGTVKQMGKDYTLADRTDPVKSREVMEFFTKSNQQKLASFLGRQPNEAELYAAHFLGSDGAIKFLGQVQRDPNVSIRSIVGEREFASNQEVFTSNGRTKTAGEIFDWMNKKMSTGVQMPASVSTPKFNYGSLIPPSPGTQTGNVLSTSSARVEAAVPQYATEIFSMLDRILDKLSKTLDVQEDILKYAKMKS